MSEAIAKEPVRAADPAAEKASLKEFFVVSADCHVNEPNDVWAARVDKQFQERLPRIKVDEKGRKWFVAEGIRPSRIREAPRDESVSVNEFVEKSERPHLDRTRGAMFQNQGGINEDRYRDMDYDGIDCEIVFPNKGLVNWHSPDPALNTAMCHAWNVWAYETFGGHSRSFPAACVAPADVEAAVAEIEWAAKHGFKSIMLPPLMKEGKGYNLPEFDPIWAAACDANMPILFHAGTGKDPRSATGNGGALINYVVHAMNTVVQPTVELCVSGVFDRFPKLKFATIEAGAGWVPYTLHAMDFGNYAHAFWVMPKLKYKPSEYYHMHGHSSFETDPIGVELRHRMGVDNLLWGNDYPHIEGCWPHSEEQLKVWGKGLTKQEIAKIIGLNSARLFNIDVPKQFAIA
ncbi:amidohydrolase family protein [Novosphingobium mangrovi (ex Huang et al. 2023)]|uniref:Amidohydrolase n=1 Tax=Novosphingobium mangrovi (ex Huang et al. 2023) TaxID=2976432 RepID=A0ABT2I8S8_9SPHN|nr:amidohydrolase family protein [Novosphingobium mangrovi (ex Huang et al. 2023)]MCT2401216.1 amidohydrolase [Novosphingobium mangrovi (ex Huang et al. 2023)]